MHEVKVGSQTTKVLATAHRSADLPDGLSGHFRVQCYQRKYFASPFGRNRSINSAVPPHRGAYRDRHGRGAGCGGRGSVLRAMGLQGGFFESVSDQQHADERRLLRTAKSCGPDAPTLASSLRKASQPYRARTSHIFRKRRWQESPVTGESSKETVKTIACGNVG